MQPLTPITTDLVLLGAGHAHVEVLRRFAMHPARGVRLTLIAREPHTPYSGMLPGLIRREYDFDQAHIDLAPLVSAANARLILAEATGIDLTARSVAVADRPAIGFDLLSIDVGGLPAMPAGDGIPVKPIGRFLDRLNALETDLPDNARIAVVGAGPAGTELALALARRFGPRFRLVLVTAAPEPLADAPPRARVVARTALVDAGIEIVCGVQAGVLADGRLVLSDGSFLDADAALWATNVIGPEFLARSGLACDEAGCVRVAPTLRSLTDPAIFAAGDCATVEGAKRPKAGVWAVRAGAILARNLRRAARKQTLTSWHPQKQALVIMGLGDGRALAWRNGVAVWGRPIWRWKDWIDRRWMRMYSIRMTPAPGEQMRCGGCGAKIGAEVLSGVLAGLPVATGPDLLVGLEAPDDAAVLRPPPGMAVVQSVDHFRAFLDDPYLFGEIAAAHALSDLHAMGARPWSALAVAAVPYLGGDKMRADLAAMMQGATRVLTADGCLLVGGHSGEALEASLGFAVTGLVEPRRIWRKSGLREGDVLVLTKPLGTGVLLAGHMRGLTKARWLVAAIASMRNSNAAAAKVLAAHGITACTDISGFGLAGHLIEMLRASDLTAVIYTEQVPLLPGALELARRGVESTLASDNRQALPAGAREPRTNLLIDPQTSGGLLAGIPPSRAEACVAALHQAGIEAAIVGETTRGPPSIRVV
ncbi:MAG TPA: selenide, water dikinase SelD [Acetobacteraceae bacterium]|nr:selenide, water dikinase SelD [Acetobacteraceae bacterium]